MQTYQLELATGDVGDVHVVGGGAQLLELLASEDVDGNEMDLGVAVLAGLRGGHVDDLAGAVLDVDVASLPQGRALHGVGQRRTGIDRVEGVLMLRIADSVSACMVRYVCRIPASTKQQI